MPRYAALLRGVSPMNCKMSALQQALERSGFTGVVTVLSSGNVVFDARSAPLAKLEARVEAATRTHLGRAFATIVRSVESLGALLASEPFAPFGPKPGEKKVVTFFKAPPPAVRLPVALGKARIVDLGPAHALTLYAPEDAGPVFMQLIEKTFGKEVTTRTWDTVAKVAAK